MDATKLYECDDWYVIESRENVPAERYEVRDPAGRRYGIWDSIESATKHLHETKDAPAGDADWLEKLITGDVS